VKYSEKWFEDLPGKVTKSEHGIIKIWCMWDRSVV